METKDYIAIIIAAIVLIGLVTLGALVYYQKKRNKKNGRLLGEWAELMWPKLREGNVDFPEEMDRKSLMELLECLICRYEEWDEELSDTSGAHKKSGLQFTNFNVGERVDWLRDFVNIKWDGGAETYGTWETGKFRALLIVSLRELEKEKKNNRYIKLRQRLAQNYT